MIRLLFIPLFALVLFSCDDSSEKFDPLFYQISEADSARCMDEILDGIIDDAQEDQRLQQEMEEKLYNPDIIHCGIPRDVFEIMINSSGNMMIDLNLDSTDVSKKIYRYFMTNRNLTSQEMIKASSNRNHPGFEYPFYNKFDLEEIERKIEETSEEFQEVRQTKGVDSILVDYFESKVDEWKKLKRVLETIGDSRLIQVSYSAHVRFEYPKESERTKEVLKEIAFAFYQMRNYECLRYFNESYLSLYDRKQRKNRKIDKKKLEALEVLHPAPIVCEDWSKPRLYWDVPSPPEEVSN